MRLHFESTGAGFPVIILHGLFGSGDNWASIARKLADRFHVLLPDLRNHGRSAHSHDMDFPVMAADVLELIHQERLGKVHMVGHSMGGKIAMQMALTAPDCIERLAVVDIAPKSYPRHHDHILDAMLALDPGSFTSLSQLEASLAQHISDQQVRRFLLKSVKRTAAGNYAWKLGVKEIAANYDVLGAAIRGDITFNGPALFLKGERSNYIAPEDEPLIRQKFPRALLATVPRADHWVHADNPADFLNLLEKFLAPER